MATKQMQNQQVRTVIRLCFLEHAAVRAARKLSIRKHPRAIRQTLAHMQVMKMERTGLWRISLKMFSML